MALRGQRARHAIKGNRVNVGDPNGPSERSIDRQV